MRNLIFLDVETGGLKPNIHGLCSIYLKDTYEGCDWGYDFYPQKKVYDYSAFKVNGFNLETLYKIGSSRERLIELIGDLAKRNQYLIFCGWNVQFDIDFILQVYREKREKLPCPILALDLCEIAKKNIKKKDLRKKEDVGVENHKLTTVYQYLFDDFQKEKAHTAQYDVEMVEKLFLQFEKFGWIDKL